MDFNPAPTGIGQYDNQVKDAAGNMLNAGFNFIDFACPNFKAGRDNMQVKAIVLHKPEGNLPEVIDYLNKPETQKSYHYIIGVDGAIYRLVDDVNEAWHTGTVVNPTWAGLLQGVNPNLYTVGIACEGFAADNLTPEQKNSLTVVVAQIAKKYNLPLNTETIVYHREIRADKTCPGEHLAKEDVIVNAQAYLDGDQSMPSKQTLENAGIACN